jgi:thiol-disulfide isomerase/thioredoxin
MLNKAAAAAGNCDMRRVVLGLFGILLASALVLGANAQDDERFVGRIPAPAFPPGLDWINVDSPLTMDGLRGKVVLLDFWTYGCINCIHMVPVLDEIGKKYADEVVIISVHSAKFSSEGQTENIRQIVRRYGIDHPVINDRDFLVWRSYGINAWPTLFVVDPRGNVVAGEAGELPFEVLDLYLGSLIAYYDGLGTSELDRTPLALALEGAGDPGTPLLFPGTVLADAAGQRLFIADSNHHRIVIADLNTYEVLDIIGSGGRGLRDGNADNAQFNQPQGIALQGTMLYVADTSNHAVRRVDLTARTVTTIAGNGRISPTLAVFGQPVGDLTTRPLRSPWGLAFGADPNTLYIAMAGMHQVHTLALDQGIQYASVGTGLEAQQNGPLETSALAQPSGLFFSRGDLYIADSESSTIRRANFTANRIEVVSGTVEDSLFDYGDIDGLAGVSRLQHALGVTGTPEGDRIFIADTYNNRIKELNPLTSATATLFGLGGLGGYRDGDASVAQFDEPGGLSYAAGRLYVADTNNHAIRVIDLASGIVSTVTFPNVERLITNPQVTVVGGNAAQGEVVTLAPRALPPGETSLNIVYDLPEGWKINTLTTSLVEVSASGGAAVPGVSAVAVADETVSVPFTLVPGEAVVTLEMSLFYCEIARESVCLIDLVTVNVPVVVAEDTAADVWQITREVVLPEPYR